MEARTEMTKLTSQTVSEIQKYYKREEFGSYVVDPHTAVGLAAQARSQKKAYVHLTYLVAITLIPIAG